MTEIAARVGLALTLLLCAGGAQASVEISSAPTSNMNCSAGVCTPTAKDSVLNVTDLTTMLTSTDVAVESGMRKVSMEVISPIAWASTHRLTLIAVGNVSIKAQVTVEGTSGLSIFSEYPGSDLVMYPGGKIDFWDTNSSLDINGNKYVLVSDLETLRKAIRANLEGFFALANDEDLHHKKFKKPPIRKFLGTFEGLGNSIVNLDIEGSAGFCEGMFAEAGKYYLKTIVIRDINLKNVRIVQTQGNYNDETGGLVGCNSASIINASVDGSVSSSSGLVNGQVGGLVGENYIGTISRSHSAASIAGGAGVAGGLVGLNFGSIDQSYATGSVTAKSAGGLIGITGQGYSVTNCYATSAITAEGQGGGLAAAVGRTISTSYSTGTIGGSGTLGGLVGYDGSGGDGVETAYWDLDTSGISDPGQGAGSPPNDPGITGLTDAQLKSGLPAGFDPSIWAQSPGINNGYPYLSANPPQ